MNIYKAVRGTRDILPGESRKWQYVTQIAKDVFEKFGYSEIITPVFESTELFTRGIGETTDIVTKEMYTFADKKGRSLTLRPEGTAGVIRAYIENGLYNEPLPVKLYYIGPMFRYERPQAGRYREHHQLGIEAIGSDNPALDAEVISTGTSIFLKLGITGLTTQLNSIGCLECRHEYIKLLKDFFKKGAFKLCEICIVRVEKNPLRILDCKEALCKEIFKDRTTPRITDFLCDSCREHFTKLREFLELLKINYVMNEYLVRGFDYYTKTVFEITSDKLGAQNAILGGGRYNNLVKELGGKQTPAVGFSIGIERLILSLDVLGIQPPKKDKTHVFIAHLGEKAFKKSIEIASILRSADFKVTMLFEDKNLAVQLKNANQHKADKVIIIGDDELKQNVVILKDMNTGKQENVREENLLKFLEA